MSLNDTLKDFSKKPLGFRLGVIAGAYAVVGLLYWQFYYSGMSDELGQLKATNTQLKQKHQKLKAREAEYKELVKQNEELKEQLIKNRVSLPTTAELPSFFVHLQKQAAASGASIRKWKRAKEKRVGFYVQVPVSITLSGTYHQILHYFKLLSQTDRIITVENLKLGGAARRNDETVLSASFTASTFRMADGTSDALFQGDDGGDDEDKKDAKKTDIKKKPTAAEATKAAKDANKATDEQADKGVERSGGEQ